ncbi:hypothetical protein AKG60_09590 [Vibrio parahaemolyticus]|uniref:DUF3990 domain-containing protein n=1 Tax=Vibrio parahaemolyticus TaxID=670 RepID=A0AAX0MCM8_VIBPH|nr:hypothetical protein [Vibrio vulnificus]EGQ8302274.1 hypothetical protein [Vibrio parahaemolyticus]ARN70157.1 hypothetical protein FORC36_5640 [Vibrio vulnificus]EGQ8892136.1 hypothetical protein [Vibrio parahaemolyticus]EGR3310027.1 hypothetical protein [Vibrio parahaemolyticus]EJG0023500.1 hypothetical protein [Vibrio parahaemolyticus]
MITTFTATPKRFDNFDFNKIGTGTGLARHGFGFYFGSPDLAKDYLSTYKTYDGADPTYMYKSKIIEPETIPYEVIEVIESKGFDQAIDHFSGMSEHIKFLNVLTNNGNGKAYSCPHRGVLYQVSIPHIDISDLKDWSETLYESDDLIDIYIDFCNKHVNPQDFDPETLKYLADAGVFIDEDTDFESIIENLLDKGFDETYDVDPDDDEIYPSATCSTDLKDICIHRAFDDYDFDDGFQEDFDNLSQKFHAAFQSLIKNTPDFHHEDFSLGDIHSALNHAISNLNPDLTEIECAKMANEFLCKNLKISGYTAEAMYGKPGEKEIVIIDQQLLEPAKIVEVNPYNDFELGYDY